MGRLPSQKSLNKLPSVKVAFGTHAKLESSTSTRGHRVSTSGNASGGGRAPSRAGRTSRPRASHPGSARGSYTGSMSPLLLDGSSLDPAAGYRMSTGLSPRQRGRLLGDGEDGDGLSRFGSLGQVREGEVGARAAGGWAAGGKATVYRRGQYGMYLLSLTAWSEVQALNDQLNVCHLMVSICFGCTDMVGCGKGNVSLTLGCVY